MTTAPPAASTPSRRGGLIGAIVVVSILLVGAIVAGFLIVRGDLRLPAAASGEVFLEAAASPGTNPFTAPVAPAPDPAIAKPTTTPAPAVTAAVQTTSQNGSTPGLYGGTQDNATCDTAQLVSFLQANPDKAAAWVGALNKDPDLRWGSAALTVAEVPAYIAQLTSIILVSNTRVTNHGYENGVATPLQYVLQAGTAVLVDRYGVPRARCFCGNPLIPPTPVPGTPTYVGNAWPGLDPSLVIVVVQNDTPVSSFEIRVPATPTGTLTTIPAGPCDLNVATCAPPGPGGSTAPPTPSATPTPSASSVPPTGQLTPPPGVACSAGASVAPAWVQYWIKNGTSAAVDIYWLPADCVPQFSVTVDPLDADDGTSFGYGWMGFEGDTYYAVPAGSPSNSTPVGTYTVSPEGTWEIR